MFFFNSSGFNPMGEAPASEIMWALHFLVITDMLLNGRFPKDISASLISVVVPSDWASNWHSGKEPACQCRRCKGHRFNVQVGKIPLEQERANHSSILCLENPMDRKAWQATALGVTKGSDTTECTHTHVHTHLLHANSFRLSPFPNFFQFFLEIGFVVLNIPD